MSDHKSGEFEFPDDLFHACSQTLSNEDIKGSEGFIQEKESENDAE